HTNIDGVILQDLGMLHLVSEYFKALPIHASTQLTTHNEGQILFLSRFKVSRVNLSRELNLNEIGEITAFGKECNISTEVFVHGSQCLSFSGICYFSSVQSGNSGNRGRCSQPCRDRYITTPAGKDYPLNLKDISAFVNLPDLVKAGVESLKIEGRIKKFDYIYTVVNSWKKQIQRFYSQQTISKDNSELYRVFNRDFSNSYLKGEIHRDMFIDDPRDHSLKHLSEINKNGTGPVTESDALKLYADKEEAKATIEGLINQVSIAKAPLVFKLAGEAGTPLKVWVETPDRSFQLESGIKLSHSGTGALTESMVLRKFKPPEETAYFIQELDLSGLEGNLFIPLGELSSLKNKVLYLLNRSKEIVSAIEVPLPINHREEEVAPSLSVLIADQKEVDQFKEGPADLYFQLPGGFKNECSELKDLFLSHKDLIPWFPSVLIGEDYHAAVDFLEHVRPPCLVTNNTGIAYEACRLGISWIAGPYLNVVNSFSLQGLKERFNCRGAFISNELSKDQIKSIRRPADFKLYYSIYHPIVLLTSRQCLFQQVTGCEKSMIDETCIQGCERSASITNLKGDALFIEKTRGNYHSIYHEKRFLNTDIIRDLPGMFSSFFIDLMETSTTTKTGVDKKGLVQLFENLIDAIPEADQELKRSIFPTTHAQYVNGI
ncbi:MAG: U32 family peptidase, partial [Bacteroidetes bacterium]